MNHRSCNLHFAVRLKERYNISISNQFYDKNFKHIEKSNISELVINNYGGNIKNKLYVSCIDNVYIPVATQSNKSITVLRYHKLPEYIKLVYDYKKKVLKRKLKQKKKKTKIESKETILEEINKTHHLKNPSSLEVYILGKKFSKNKTIKRLVEKYFHYINKE